MPEKAKITSIIEQVKIATQQGVRFDRTKKQQEAKEKIDKAAEEIKPPS